MTDPLLAALAQRRDTSRAAAQALTAAGARLDTALDVLGPVEPQVVALARVVIESVDGTVLTTEPGDNTEGVLKGPILQYVAQHPGQPTTPEIRAAIAPGASRDPSIAHAFARDLRDLEASGAIMRATRKRWTTPERTDQP